MILENLRAVLARIEAAARRAGRDPAHVSLVAVTKTASAEAVAELLRCGLVGELGESRVRDAAAKSAELLAVPGLPRARWRLIGHLQRNKARQALDCFDAVDSLDSLRLAEALEAQLESRGRDLPVLAQVKLAASATRHGVSPEELPEFLRALGRMRRLKVSGLMAIAPMLEPVEAVRPHFRRMKELFDRSFPGDAGKTLSMGMSRDFEIAVEEGADLVRVGSALFEP